MKLALIIGIIGSLVILSGCVQAPEQEDNQTNGELNIQMPNPASLNCVSNGGSVDIRDTPDGQVGYCTFSDGSECEEWTFYRSECTIETASPCKDLCGDGECQEMVCEAIGCPCAETAESCPWDCA